MPFKLGIEVDFDVEFLFFSEITMLSAGSRRLATLIAPFFDNLLFANFCREDFLLVHSKEFLDIPLIFQKNFCQAETSAQKRTLVQNYEIGSDEPTCDSRKLPYHSQKLFSCVSTCSSTNTSVGLTQSCAELFAGSYGFVAEGFIGDRTLAGKRKACAINCVVLP